MPYVVKSKLRTFPNVFTNVEEYRKFCSNLTEYVSAVLATELLISERKILSINSAIDNNKDLIFTRTWDDQQSADDYRNGPVFTAWKNKWTELGWVLTPLESYTT